MGKGTIPPPAVARRRSCSKILRVRLRIGSMADSTKQEASHGNVDHGLGDIQALFVVAHETAPAGEPGEGSLDDPSAGQNLEAGFAIDAADALDDEVEEGRLVHELGPV